MREQLWLLMLIALAAGVPALAAAADKSTAPQLIELAKSNSPALRGRDRRQLRQQRIERRHGEHVPRRRIFLCARSRIETSADD